MRYLRPLVDAGSALLLPCYGGGRRPLLIAKDGSSGIMSVAEIVRKLFPDSVFSWWMAPRRRRVHLIAETCCGRIGFCFTSSPLPGRGTWLPLTLALRQSVIQRGFLLHAGDAAFFKERAIIAMPRAAFIEEPSAWMLYRRTLKTAREAVWRINRERLAAWAAHR